MDLVSIGELSKRTGMNSWQKAYTLLNKYEGVSKVRYKGEILYNILMENHSSMLVHNMICETLHPKNLTALLYSKHTMFDENQIDLITKKLNNYIINNDNEQLMKLSTSLLHKDNAIQTDKKQKELDKQKEILIHLKNDLKKMKHEKMNEIQKLEEKLKESKFKELEEENNYYKTENVKL